MASLYVPTLSHPPQPNPPLDWGDIWRVTSAPASTVGRNGDLAVNINTGDIYEKYSDTWTLFTGGGGGSGTAYLTGVGSPVGAETATFVGELYTRQDVFELWQSTGLTNADWIQIV